MKTPLRFFAAALLTLGIAARAFALGTGSYSSELVSARSLGQGGTGVAGVDPDATVSYLNPAAMTGMPGLQFTGGGAYANARPTFTNDSSASSPSLPAGAVEGARATSVVAPDFGATVQLLDGKLAAGVSVVSPFGLESHFDADSPVRYYATDSRLRVIDVSPAVAVKLGDALSVGVAADYYDTVEGQLSQALNVTGINSRLGFPSAAADGSASMTATGGGFGYHLGATFRPSESSQIGLVYHSNVKMSLSGNTNLTGLTGASATAFGGATFNTAVSAPLFIPQNLQLGWAFNPSRAWRLEADAAWYDWYAARQLGLVYSGNYNSLPASAQAVLQTGNPLQFHPRNTLNFALGANYAASEALQLRGGAYYEAASLPESAFDPGFVDLPRYGLTVGAGYRFGPSLSADFAYNAVFFHTREISTAGYSGAFDSFANILSAQLNYKIDTRF
jgi:long-chain fatty acid transport protein